jgi:membrane protease YdiL (CAAX protease family)
MPGGTGGASRVLQWGVNARRCFVQAVAALLIFALVRAFGPAVSPAISIAALTVVLVVIARISGATLGDLALRPADSGAGLRYGGAASGVVLIALLLAAALPATRNLLHDQRAEIDGGQVIYEIGVSIVLLIAIPEEFAFRGVLLGSAVSLWRERQAMVITSALFGVWHIQPTLATMSDNPGVSGLSGTTSGRLIVVLSAVVVTFVAGLVFGWLRLRSRSLLASVLAHVATNGLGLTVAWITVRWSALR